MDKIVHPSQLRHVEKEIDQAFYKYYQHGTKKEYNDFSIHALKKWIKNEVDTFCYTDLLFIAGCIDYLCLEICELAGKVANENRKIRVTAEHVDEAIANDAALSYTFKPNKKSRTKK